MDNVEIKIKLPDGRKQLTFNTTLWQSTVFLTLNQDKVT